MNDSIKKNLQKIVDICKDGVEGYSRAATELEDGELKTIFGRLSQQRKLFIEEIKDEARDYGVKLDIDGTTKGDLHRFWLTVKSKLTGHDDEKIIEASLTGENAAVETYHEVLQENDLPSNLRDTLSKQVDLVSGAITQLKEFKKSVAH